MTAHAGRRASNRQTGIFRTSNGSTDRAAPGTWRGDARLFRSAISPPGGSGTAASRLAGVVVPTLRRQGGALLLPWAGKGVQVRDVPIAIVGLMVMPRRPDLVRRRPHQHVQDLVSVIAGFEQSSRRLPDLGRVVVPELCGDDFMHREMKARVDRSVAEIDLVQTLLKCTVELGMFMTDHGGADIPVAQILDIHRERRKHLRIRDEASVRIVVAGRRVS
jgi:hypothetical protein